MKNAMPHCKLYMKFSNGALLRFCNAFLFRNLPWYLTFVSCRSETLTVDSAVTILLASILEHDDAFCTIVRSFKRGRSKKKNFFWRATVWEMFFFLEESSWHMYKKAYIKKLTHVKKRCNPFVWRVTTNLYEGSFKSLGKHTSTKHHTKKMKNILMREGAPQIFNFSNGLFYFALEALNG